MYHSGQMGLANDCYTAGRTPVWEDEDKVDPLALRKFDRLYSPFMATSAASDYKLPEYLLPARVLYMSIGGSRGGGVIPEEHPSGWFAGGQGAQALGIPPAQPDPARTHARAPRVPAQAHSVHIDADVRPAGG